MPERRPVKPARWGWYRNYRRARRFTPESMIIDRLSSPSTQSPGVGEVGIPAVGFVPDGFNYPRPDSTFFDVVVRVATIPPATTVDQIVFTQGERIKGGYVRRLGYEFNNPHGYFQCRTFILLADGVPSNYIFKTVESGATTPEQYQGSFPTSQIGSVDDPTQVFIYLPAATLVKLRFVNVSTTETFAATVRMVGWSFGT